MKRHILLVEDDAQTVTVTKFMLEHAGFQVKVAGNGYDALEFVRTFKYDLILLDLNLPMINGFNFLERMRGVENGAGVPVIVLTVRDDKDSIIKAKKLGADQYLLKPPKKEELLRKIETTLGGRPQFRQVRLAPAELEAQAQLSYAATVASISEVGLILHCPIPLEPGTHLKNIRLAVLEKLGIEGAKLLVSECKKESDHYVAFISFIDFKEREIRAIREWVVSHCLQNSGGQAAA